MANPEGGLMGFFSGIFNKLFRREAEKKIAQQIQGEKKITKTKEERKEKKERADEVFQEFARVTTSHPAYEVLRGASVTREMIERDPDLGNVLLDIIHTVNSDPAKYHDPKWLQGKMRALTQRLNSPNSRLSDTDKSEVSTIEKNVEDLYKKSQKDRRDADLDAEIDRVQAGELSPDSEQPELDTGKKTKYNVPEQSWKQIIASLPDDPDPSNPDYKTIRERISTAYEATNTDDARAKLQAEYNLADAFVNAQREASMKITPGDDIAIGKYKAVQKAFEAAGSDFLKKNPREGGRFMAEMRKHGNEYVEKRIQVDADYRDYWFYRILENVLYNHKIDSHRELYQLYESGEMHDFLEIVRRIKTDDGRRIGLNLAERYDILKNTIFQSHDMDYYCAHPQQDMKEFIGSTSLFLNEYIDAATQDPMVALAKRMYEQALFHMRDSHSGYLPREWLVWEEGKTRASKLDDMVAGYLKQAIASGQLHNVKFDKITELAAPSMWNRKQITDEPYTLSDLYGGESEHSEGIGRQLGELKIAAALKQAKGLALVDHRLLEIIGKSKGTGTKYEVNGENWGANAFNSVPYEGIVRYIDPVIHYYGRFGVGMDISNAFFNMMVSDSSKYKWDPKHMQTLIPLYLDGKYEEAKKYAADNNLGDISTRLSATDNPFGYSGMWGTMTKWRVADATAGFDDWEKDQAYAAAVKLTNIGDVFSAPERQSSFQKYGSTWAYRKAKEYFTEINNSDYKKYREEFRNYLLNSDEMRYKKMAEENGDAFKLEWRTVGIRRYRKKLDEVLIPFLNDHGKYPKDKIGNKPNELYELTRKLERAYKARTWVQTAMKAPLIAARELNVKLNHGVDIEGEPLEGPLRKKIIWEILGIDLDDMALLGGQGNLTPTAIQEAQFDRISDVEGALASLQQTAIRENRDLTKDDFDKAITALKHIKHIDDVSHIETGDPKQVKNFEYAKEYWLKVKHAMLGSNEASSIYDALGIQDADRNLPRGLRFHKINWDKIQNISLNNKDSKEHFIVDGFGTELLNNELIDRNWRHLFSTEDMGWEFLNINALGSRNPVRRAGDLGSHVAFGQLFEQYLMDFVQRPVGKVDDMVEHLHKMFAAMSGDFQDTAAEACARVAYSTGMIYKQADWAWKLPLGTGQIGSLFKATSISQEIHGRDRGISWGPNEMLHWVQAVGSHILPKAKYSKFTGEETMPNSDWDRAKLGKYLGGTKTNAVYEILNMTAFLATMITLYRALSAKSEEEEE